MKYHNKNKLSSNDSFSKHTRYYREKGEDYFSSGRSNIVDLVPDGPNSILDVGCGNGSILLNLKNKGKASEIVGVEITKLPASNGIDNLIVGDIEELELPYNENYFDILICADILEHLRDPWGVLQELVPYLKPDGLCIISIPNIREIKTIFKVAVKGDFKYTDSGILDKTHLRFFCKKNMIELINGSGLVIQDVIPCMGKRRNIINKMILGLVEELFAVQYIFISNKRNDK